jgi:cystathionine beta-lyase
MKNDDRPRHYRKDTLLTHVGRDPEANFGIVNPPVYHASTILSKNMAEWEAKRAAPPFSVIRYGLHGTPTTFALEELLAKIEGGYRSMIVSSGLAAVTGPLQALLGAGDHCLMVDSAYGPARNFCEGILKKCGVETTYYDPLIGEGIAKLIRPNTKVVYCESPGSLTFEIQDIPAIAAVAHRHGAKVLMDNTWGTPYLFRSFEHGVDVSIHAATKYICGHSDVMLGAVIMNEETLPAGALGDGADRPQRRAGRRVLRAARHAHLVGAARAAPAQRDGSRQMAADPARSVARALPGAARRPRPRDLEARFPRRLRPLRRGAKAGLERGGLRDDRRARPVRHRRELGRVREPHPADVPERTRTATKWDAEGPGIRIHIGLEDPQEI